MKITLLLLSLSSIAYAGSGAVKATEVASESATKVSTVQRVRNAWRGARFGTSAEREGAVITRGGGSQGVSGGNEALVNRDTIITRVDSHEASQLEMDTKAMMREKHGDLFNPDGSLVTTVEAEPVLASGAKPWTNGGVAAVAAGSFVGGATGMLVAGGIANSAGN